MEIKCIKAKPLTYDPYEEDCCGGHDGDTVEITFNGGEKLIILEKKSGIGDSMRVHVLTRGGRKSQAIDFGVDDDGIVFP